MNKTYVATVEVKIEHRVYIEGENALDVANYLENCSDEFIEQFEPKAITREVISICETTEDDG